MTSPAPNELELDALREVANIGCGHAATALSRLVGGRTVRIDVPRVHVTGAPGVAEEWAGDQSLAAAVFLDIEGEVSGKMVLLWSEEDAELLLGLLLGPKTAPSGDLLMEQTRQSALEEAGNIVASACLSAVATLTRLRLLPSAPRLSRLKVAEAVRSIVDGRGDGRAVVLEARFHASHVPPLTGTLLLVPDADSLPRMFAALGI